MKNNKGFSLIEVVVVLAILSVVGSVILGFIYISTHSYMGVSGEADLQYNAQLVVNQIENILIDSTKGLAYSYGDSSGNEKKVISDQEISGNPTRKVLAVYTTGEVYYITWHDKQLQLRKDTVDGAGNTLSVGKDVKMADNVTFFAADLSKAKKNKVRLDFIFESGKKVYKSTKDISLRNTLSVNGDTTEMYDEEPEIVVSVDRVSIGYKGSDVTSQEVGMWVERSENSLGNIKLTATVHGNVLLSEVIWAISGNTSADTRIEGGSLTLGGDESSDRITVTAISKNDTSKSASTVVLLKEITGVNIRISSGKKSDYYKGDSFEVSGEVIGTNLTPEDKKLTWAASGATFAEESNGTIMATITASAKETVVIGATATSNSSYHAELDPIIVSTTIYKVHISSGTTTLLRNGSVDDITARVSPASGHSDIKWIITKIVNNATGAEVNTNAISINGNNGKASIQCSSSLEWRGSYTVYYKAYVEAEGERFESAQEAVRIDSVSVNVWQGYTRYTVTSDTSQTIKAAKGSVNYYGFEVFGINAKMTTNSNSSRYVASTEMYDDAFKVVLTSDAKNSEPKIPIIVMGKRLNYVYFNTN